jgi:putative aldouronate transport system permease protein
MGAVVIKRPTPEKNVHDVFKPKYSTIKRMLLQWDLQILVVPAIVYIFVFMYIPMFGMLMAFQQYRLGDFPGFSQWVGFEYFIQLFNDPNFPRVLRNTLAMSSLRIIFGFPMPIIFAIMLNEVRIIAFKRVTQTISYLPHFISWVVAATLMFDFFSVDNGAINNMLMFIGFTDTPINFFGRSQYFWGLATVTDIWKGLGWNAIIYVAAITSIDSELYEAASIDGAGRMAKIWHITIAGIKPTIIILFILAMGGLLNSNFDQVWMLTRQMNNVMLRETADVIDTYILRVGIREFRYSFGAAAGVFRTVINFTLVLIANYVANKAGEGGRGLF